MKKTFLFLSILIIAALACDLSVSVSPSSSPAPLPTITTIPASEIPTEISISASPIPATVVSSATPTTLQSSSNGVPVFFGPVSLVLPSGLASGISGDQFPRNEGENVAPWEVTPGHAQITLEGYLLQGKFHQPQIYVYPASSYVEMYPPTFESIHRLDNILYGPAAPNLNEPLPTIPFFNAAQVFASNVQAISFQGGSGVRFLTEYAQYAAPVNNHDLFYHFQGLTRDGTYYVIVILPITVPVLAETSDAGAALPPGGIAYPDINDPNADFQGYYSAVTALLNTIPPELFAPTLGQLDLLIQSMQITP